MIQGTENVNFHTITDALLTGRKLTDLSGAHKCECRNCTNTVEFADEALCYSCTPPFKNCDCGCGCS